VIVEGQGTVEQAVIVEVIGPARGPAIGPRIVEGQGTVEQAVIVEVIGPVRGPATEPRIVEVGEIALEIEVFRQDQTAVLGGALSATQAAVLAVHARAVREAQQAREAPAAVARVVAGEGGKSMIRDIDAALKKAVVCRKSLLTFLPVLVVGIAAGVLIAAPQSGKASSAPSPVAQQRTFATPQQAADALVQAAGTYDLPALSQILGPDSKDLLSSEDPVRDKSAATEFAAKGREKTEVTVDPKNAGRATVLVGDDGWPLPIPLVKKANEWLFDTKAGRQEILYRRIGSNELDAIEICRGYVDAQKEYALKKHDNSELNQYAQRIISTPGKHDGLVWYNPDGTFGGPIAEGIARALQAGYTDKSKPYHGYYFKILKGQGPAAPLGQMDFLVGGAMIGGFALAAGPAEYRVTGVKTFIISYEGIVYQKDLGPDTLKIFREMELYNPDKTWTRTNDNW